MNQQFIEHVKNKWNPFLTFEQAFDNVMHGIVGEMFEVLEADHLFYSFDAEDVENAKELNDKQKENVLDEAGDLIFYFTVYPNVTEQEFLFEQFNQCNPVHIINYLDLFRNLNTLISQSKKYLYHKKELDLNVFNQSILNLYSFYLEIIRNYEFDLETIMMYNINKLEKRHGVGKNFKTFDQRLDKI